MYIFLSQDCKAHLPSLQSTNSYFLSEILKGDKNFISRDSVRVSAIPQLEGLTVMDLLSLAQQHEQVMSHLPSPCDWKNIDKKWMGDILYTIIPDQLQELIDQARQKQFQRKVEKRSLDVQLRPEFAEAFNRCMLVSSGNGRAVTLLKSNTKRRRTRQECEETKEEEEHLRADRKDFFLQVKRLKTESQQMQPQRAQMRSLTVMSDNFGQRHNQENHPLQSQSLNKQQFII